MRSSVYILLLHSDPRANIGQTAAYENDNLKVQDRIPTQVTDFCDLPASLTQRKTSLKTLSPHRLGICR